MTEIIRKSNDHLLSEVEKSWTAHKEGHLLSLKSKDYSPSQSYMPSKGRPRSKHRTFHPAMFLAGVIVGILLTSVFTQVSRTESQANLPRILPGFEFSDNILTQINVSDKEVSQFTGRPRPELEAAWDRLERYRAFGVSATDIAAAGNGPDSIIIPESVKQGDQDEHFVTLEVIYHMHCLNFLRKATYYNYEHYMDQHVFNDPIIATETRLDRCIDVLRQIILCKSDTTITPYYWVSKYPYPYPNWNTWHQCSNVEALMDWSDTHTIRFPSTWDEWRKGAERVEFPDWVGADHHHLGV